MIKLPKGWKVSYNDSITLYRKSPKSEIEIFNSLKVRKNSKIVKTFRNQEAAIKWANKEMSAITTNLIKRALYKRNPALSFNQIPIKVNPYISIVENENAFYDSLDRRFDGSIEILKFYQYWAFLKPSKISLQDNTVHFEKTPKDITPLLNYLKLKNINNQLNKKQVEKVNKIISILKR